MSSTTAGQQARRQPKRKEEILRAASRVMSSRGVMTTRLQDVAEDLNVAYTALYHYFPSRDHLAEEVILWRLKARRKLLSEVEGDSALDCLLEFFRREMTEDKDHQIRFPPFSALPPENRVSLWDVRDALLKDMTSLIDLGIREGSIRPCHSQTVANAILGMIERFVQVDQENMSVRIKQMPNKQFVEGMSETLRIGILSNRAHLLRPSFMLERPEDLLGYDPELDQELRRLDDILKTATRHFNVEGAEASIPRIAADLGVSKTVVYQYVMDKQDLLLQCYLRGAGVVEMSHRIASDLGRDPLDEILIHRLSLYRFHDSEVGPFTFINAVHFLHPQQQRLVRMRNRAVRQMSEARMRRGINAGEIRPGVDPEIAQPMFGQMLYSLPAWFSDSYPLNIEEVCSQTGQIVLVGLEN